MQSRSAVKVLFYAVLLHDLFWSTFLMRDIMHWYLSF